MRKTKKVCARRRQYEFTEVNPKGIEVIICTTDIRLIKRPLTPPEENCNLRGIKYKRPEIFHYELSNNLHFSSKYY
jgi:hypothetical protein